jgi:hypothetical protein
MKTLFAPIIFLLFFEAGSQSFSVSENGKYNESNVVVAEGFSVAALFENGNNWLHAHGPIPVRIFDLSIDSLQRSYTADMEINTYSQSGIFKKQTGTITYHFQLEIKEGKYRYAFSGFQFHYFATDRNFKVVDTRKTKQLEEETAAGWLRLWKLHKQEAYSIVQKQIDDLNKAMIFQPNIAVQKANPKIEW